MKYEIRSVPLSLIDLEDDTFRITTTESDDALASSIKFAGLIHPPLLVPADAQFVIVSGFRRIRTCRRIEWNSIPAFVADPGMSNLQLARIAIADNLSQRELNWVEISRSLHLLSKFLDDSSRLPVEAGKLSLPCRTPSMIEKVKKVKDMPEAVQEGAISGRIALPIALELSDLDKNSGSILALIFQELKLSLSKQREILSLIREISLRDNISIMAVLEATGIDKIMGNSDEDRGQMARQLRLNLKQMRFPSITRHETEFKNYHKSLNLPHGANLIPPKDFEGNAYTLKFQFKNTDELTGCRKTIDHILQHPVTKSMMK